MTEPSQAPLDPPPVVQARRVEIVDADGHVRAWLGLPEPGEREPDLPVVLQLSDTGGTAAVTLRIGDAGAEFAFSVGGNFVATFGAYGPTSDAPAVRSFFHLADDSGTPRVGWVVAPDGHVGMVDPESE